MPTLWHKILTELLSPLLDAFYTIQTEVPISKLPLEADLFIIRKRNHPSPRSRACGRV